MKSIKHYGRSALLHHFVRLLLSLVVVAYIPLLSLVGCQSKLIYFPRPMAPA